MSAERTPKVLEIIRVAAADCHVQGNTMAHLELLDAAVMVSGLLQELRNIANADTYAWDDKLEFEAWAKSRARAAIAKAEGA